MATNWIQDVDPESGKARWRCCWATIWRNSSGRYTWHTWDEDGIGGENDVEDTLGEAKDYATLAAVRQGFLIPAGDYKQNDTVTRELLLNLEGLLAFVDHDQKVLQQAFGIHDKWSDSELRSIIADTIETHRHLKERFS